MNPNTVKVLRAARRIIVDGGDPRPCELGTWCPYCAIGIAKGDVVAESVSLRTAMLDVIRDDMLGVPIPERPEDEPLVEARNILKEFVRECVHTQESTLEALDAAIKSAVAP